MGEGDGVFLGFLGPPTKGQIYRVVFVDPTQPLPPGAELIRADLAAEMISDALAWYARAATPEARERWGPSAGRTVLAKLPASAPGFSPSEEC